MTMYKKFMTVAASTLACAGLASASPLQGVSIESLGDMGYGQTYRVFVNLDAGARIDAVFGNSIAALSIGTADGMSFYQNSYGGPTSTSTNSDFFPLVPSLEWDSYVTIGALYANGSPFANNDLLDIGVDWSSFNAGGSIETDNGSWFITPADAQGEEMFGSVLIGQFTVVGGTGSGYHDLVMQFNLQGKDADGVTWQAYNVGQLIPTPGAMALLGLAGFAGRRRRR